MLRKFMSNGHERDNGIHMLHASLCEADLPKQLLTRARSRLLDLLMEPVIALGLRPTFCKGEEEETMIGAVITPQQALSAQLKVARLVHMFGHAMPMSVHRQP